MTKLAVLVRLAVSVAILTFACGRGDDPPPATVDASPGLGAREFEVEAACGECKFGLEGSSCDLAVRIDGKAYFVDGTAIDDHGDAHAADGFCNAIRRAMVSGSITDGRFVAKSFRLLPANGR